MSTGGAGGGISNPLEESLTDPGALTLSGVSNTGLNQPSVQLRYHLQGAEFDQDLASVRLSINGTAVPLSALTLTATELVASVMLSDGKNDLSLKAYDAIGRPLYMTESVWAGTNALTVNVVDASGAPYLQPVSVRLSLSDDPGIGASGSTPSSTLTFANVPSRTVVLEAKTDTNLVGVSGGVGSDGVITIRILAFDAVSPVANNDLSLGLDGWSVGSSPVSVVEHSEGFPAVMAAVSEIAAPSRRDGGRRSRPPLRRSNPASLWTAPLAFADNDLQLTTSGEGAQSLSRTFATSVGTSSVVVRYRFITTEVPGGYFGSQYNDYFSVSLRSLNGGKIASENSTMNGLKLAAFDLASGATAWRTVTLQTDPKGDVIQLDSSVANVADGTLDSYVVIDFVAEKQDKVQPAMVWNSTAGGLNLTYTVEGSALTSAVTISVFWARGTTYASRIGAPFFSYVVPNGTAVGPGGPIAIPGASLIDDPSDAAYLLGASSETKTGSLENVRINYGVNADAGAVSAGMVDIIKDGLRAAGQASATVTSTARTPEDQARAMFKNLVNPAYTVAANVATNLGVYAPPGDAVISVFSTQTQGMTLDQIILASATIQTAMLAEINAQGPSNVSRHCADPAVVSVVDVDAPTFNASNGPLFRSSVAARVTRFIDEPTNRAYHLELAR